jgi:hypothetical protein
MGSLITNIVGYQPKTKFGDPPSPCTMSRIGGYFQKLSYGSKTSVITSEGLGEMFDGDGATENFPHVDGGLSVGSSMRIAGSEDPHRRD